ncbi:hypothetical protein RUM44_010264 [Polyplax serrata]|uniref:Serine/threonine-protein phosphatase 6 regulatory subunit 3 n=1 Tax=Polyplax serrata TaxID=468196 RepID=A0ABR1AV39_POLSC
MFWNSAAASVNFEVLLSKEDVTLQEIMDDDGVLQECSLVQSDVLEKLVRLTIEEPQGDEDDAVKYKYSNIACELLTCEVPPLSESLANDKALLGTLYSFLDTDAPLNPLLASFFSKTLSVLITRNSEQFTCLKVLEFLKLKEDSISLLLKHLGTSAIMDLILKLVTKIEGSDLNDIALNWLDEQKLVQRLVALLDPSVDSDRHCNAAQLLCDLINILRSNKMEVLQQNTILDRIETPEVVNLLLDHILKEPKCETSILGGISVLLVLLEDKWHDNGRLVFDENARGYMDYLKVVASTTNAILPRLKDFHEILINPPVKPAVRTTVAVLDPPLGAVRVEVAKLLSVLVARDNVEINKELAELGTLNVLLDLFFKYTWNNFLHTQVQKCLIYAFSLYPTSDDVEIQRNGLVAHILSKCHLIQRILEAWKENETQQTEEKRPRRGYMGHLIEIAKEIFRLAQTHSFSALMTETVDNETLNKWENFVNTTLYEIQETYMGGSKRCLEKDGMGKNGSFGDFSQVLFSNYYHSQSLGAPYSGDFRSFQDSQNLNSDSNDIGDRDSQGQENSSSDEDNEDTMEKNKNADPQMDFYGLSSWPGEGDTTGSSADGFNPWASSALNDVASDIDWANFESAPFVANFGLNFTPDINTTIATSASHEIDTIPLDLTPNENSSNIDEIFAKGVSEAEMPEITENIPTSIEFTDLEIITSAISKVSIETAKEQNVNPENVAGVEANDKKEESGEKKEECPEGAALEAINNGAEKNECLSRDENSMNRIKTSDVIENVNSIGNTFEEKELDGNFRFTSSQGLMTNNEREPESEDNSQLLKENVQAVPNEATQNSNPEVNRNSSEDKSANGPI